MSLKLFRFHCTIPFFLSVVHLAILIGQGSGVCHNIFSSMMLFCGVNLVMRTCEVL